MVGPGRSGSTLFANVLGEMPGVVAAGEVRWLFRRGMLDDRLCGCGLPPAGCEVWGPVIERVREVAPAGEILGWQREVASLRRRRGLLRGTDVSAVLQRYVEAMSVVYDGLAQTTGARWIVDSSKRPQDLAVVLRSAGSERTIAVHLMRDPQAVARSWSRAKPQPDRPGGGRMRRNPPLKSALRWSEINIGAEMVRRAHPGLPWVTIRYEDLVDQPRRTFRRVVDLAGMDRAGLPFTDERTVQLGVNHMVAGNPDRFTHGRVEIRRSSGEGESLPLWHRAMVAALTAPVARRYGYPVDR